MARLRYAGVVGTIGSGNLTSSATTHTFTAALTYGNALSPTTLPTLTGSDFFYLTILDASGNLSEVVKVTAYNSGTKAATIVRGQDGTAGVAHTSGDKVTMASYPSELGAIPKSTVVGSDVVIGTAGAYTTITGMSFTITPTVPGVLMMNSAIRCKTGGSGSLYLRTALSPSPVTGLANIGSSKESIPSNALQTFALLGNYDLAAGTAYTVTVEYFQSAGTFTMDHSESYLTGVFLPY